MKQKPKAKVKNQRIIIKQSQHMNLSAQFQREKTIMQKQTIVVLETGSP